MAPHQSAQFLIKSGFGMSPMGSPAGLLLHKRNSVREQDFYTPWQRSVALPIEVDCSGSLSG